METWWGLRIIFFTVRPGPSDYCYLEDLYVCDAARGKHIGKQLIEYVQRKQENITPAIFTGIRMKPIIARNDCTTGLRKKAG
jgi:GNAT superfamily N-acetyltransferase